MNERPIVHGALITFHQHKCEHDHHRLSRQCIYTVNPSQPSGNCLAVRDGGILSVASLDEIRHFGDYTIDERFIDQMLMSRLELGHNHVLSGASWDSLYLGGFDKTDPGGKRWPGLRETELVHQ